MKKKTIKTKEKNGFSKLKTNNVKKSERNRKYERFDETKWREKRKTKSRDCVETEEFEYDGANG